MLQTERLRELILLLCSTPDEKRGAVKLNKLLWACDFLAYRRLGRSITDATYRKKPHGPVPDGIDTVIRELQDVGAIDTVTEDYFELSQRRVHPNREARRDLFSDQELGIVERVMAKLQPMNATEASEWSHDFIGYRMVDDGDEIPYASACLGDARPMTDEEIERVRAIG